MERSYEFERGNYMAKEDKFSNGEITVHWKPDICARSGECVKGSPEVFKPEEKPWVKIGAASTDAIKETVDKCPSGALSYTFDAAERSLTESDWGVRITTTKNGPYLIAGRIEIEDSNGNITVCENKTTALCRCGASSTKPFCDGSHKNVKFFG